LPFIEIVFSVKRTNATPKVDSSGRVSLRIHSGLVDKYRDLKHLEAMQMQGQRADRAVTSNPDEARAIGQNVREQLLKITCDLGVRSEFKIERPKGFCTVFGIHFQGTRRRLLGGVHESKPQFSTLSSVSKETSEPKLRSRDDAGLS
jgi:hypothetical protein